MKIPIILCIYLCLTCLTPRPTLGDQVADDEGDGKGSRPRGLAAEVLNSTTISLTWKHPKIVTEDCPIKRYVLRLKQDGARRSRAWKVDGARKALGLHNLKPDTLYSIRLVAITCAGKGKPSKWVDIMTSTTRRDDKDKDARSPREEPVGIESRPPGRPTNVRTRTYPDSVILNWLAPTESEVVVRGYMVGYGEGVPDVNWQYVDANQRNVTIKNLKPSTQYIISLRAFNKIGKGPTVYDMIYTRELSGPTIDPETIQKPENVRAKVLSSTNIWLQWKDPSLDMEQVITDSRYYNVHYQSIPDGEKLSVVVKALHVVLYELTPGTEYEFTVRTVKDSFYSEFSDPIRNITYETGVSSNQAPGSAPRSLTVTPINGTNAVQISWRPPKEPNGKIKGYLVLHSKDRLQPIAEWNAMATAETNALVRNLDHGMVYYFKVQARNTIGYGPLSKTSEIVVPRDGELEELPKASLLIDSTAVEEEDYDEDDPDDREGLEESPASGNMAQNATDLLNSLIHNNYEGDSSSGNKIYNVTETPETATSHSQLKTMASRNEIHFAAKVLHTINAFITWPATPPGCNCEQHANALQYVFHLYMLGQEGLPQMRHLRSNVVHLESLDPNQRYHYQVKYIFPNGTETAWSQEQNLDTDCRGAST